MPVWFVPEQIYDLPRNIALLDTNVLISLANPADSWHDNTVAALDMGEFTWAVTHSSLIEAWNFLVGKQKREEHAYSLMNWVFTPGEAILIGDAIESMSAANMYSQRFRIDLVDANLVDLADRVSRQCGIDPAVHVATYDTRDFMRLFGPSGLNFNVYDMRDTSSTAG